MLVARLIDVLVPLFAVGLLMLIGVRFFRGAPGDSPEGQRRESSNVWQILGRVFLGFGVYFFLTRFFR